jgi:mannosyltransferase
LTIQSVRKTQLALAGLVLAGTLLRLANLSRALWEDELLTIDIAISQHFQAFFHRLVYFEANMAPYYFLIRWWSWVSLDDWFLRLPSVFFGVAAIPVLYALSRRMLSREEGFIACALLTIHGTHIYYSQELRAYSLLILLACLSYFFLLRAIDLDSLPDSYAWVGITACAVYVHFLAALIIIAQAVAILWARPPLNWRRLFRASAVLFVMLLPALWFVVMRNAGQIAWVPRPSWQAAWRIAAALAGDGPGFFPNAHPWVTYALVGISTVLALGGVAVSIRTLCASPKPLRWHASVLLCWLLVPIAVTLVASFRQPIFFYRYLLLCIPAALLLIAQGIWRLPWRPLVAASLLALLVLQASNTMELLRWPGRHDCRSATFYIGRHAQPGDLFVTYSYWVKLAYGYYLYELPPDQRKWPTVVHGYLASETVQNVIGQHRTVWLLEPTEDTRAEQFLPVVRTLANNMRLREQQEFLGCRVSRYEPSPRDP